jgi:hypothetical protein
MILLSCFVDAAYALLFRCACICSTLSLRLHMLYSFVAPVHAHSFVASSYAGIEGAARLADELKRDQYSELDYSELAFSS